MAKFKYIAKDENATTVTGKVTAESKELVIKELRKRSLIIISVEEDRGFSLKDFSVGEEKVKSEDLVIFTRQLSTMIDAGIPILQSLEALEEQVTQKYFKSVISAVREDVSVGNSLSASFSKHVRVFDSLFISMVKAGETGGALSALLDRIAGYMEKALKLRNKVKSAMVYPAVVITMAVLITVLLLVKVVPTFKGIYESLGKELPGMTQILIFISDNLKASFLWLVLAGIAGFVFFVNYKKTQAGSLQIDRISLKLPIFGPLIQKVALSRFSRTLATLIQSGVPILTALDIVGKSSGNRVIELTVEDAAKHIQEGESISEPLIQSGVFPQMVTRMISVGEKTGKLDTMLTKIAEFYEDQVDAAVAGLTSMIEPLIIGFLGIVVGFIVIALFLPIISLTSAIR
ncbi:MAG TPA: type II secretion system F family protein [Candidatus Omnitrophota bacterium]|nr:type II secretion system F family protein [Candidatus Omnitrophota bacterium]HQL41276.1 type II secretion system F family protein [Candidatus Omnitrophota bacterium]